MAELCSHELNAANWFLGSKPEAVHANGGVLRFKDGREVFDHVYATFEYPTGQTAVFSSVESNAFDDYYEMFMGTKGTLILRREIEALRSRQANTWPFWIAMTCGFRGRWRSIARRLTGPAGPRFWWESLMYSQMKLTWVL